MNILQLGNSSLLFYGFANSFTPEAQLVTSMEQPDPSAYFQEIQFNIVGSRMNIETIICKELNSTVYCGVIHTGHLITWLKASISSEGNVTSYSSRTFMNHPLWRPTNLEINEEYLAVETQSTNATEIPRILLYNLNGGQYVWYSISLKEASVTNLEILSFILVMINNNANIIVANRRERSSYLIYYQIQPMILSVTQPLTPSDLSSIYLNIGGDGPLSSNVTLSQFMIQDPPYDELQYRLLDFFAIVAALLAFVLAVAAVYHRLVRTREYIADEDTSFIIRDTRYKVSIAHG